jgi:hypothetical protein
VNRNDTYQESFDFFVVGDNTVVNNNEICNCYIKMRLANKYGVGNSTVLAIRALWMRVHPVGFSVGRPASVSNAAVGLEIPLKVERVFHVCEELLFDKLVKKQV